MMLASECESRFTCSIAPAESTSQSVTLASRASLALAAAGRKYRMRTRPDNCSTTSANAGHCSSFSNNSSLAPQS